MDPIIYNTTKGNIISEVPYDIICDEEIIHQERYCTEKKVLISLCIFSVLFLATVAFIYIRYG